MFDLLERIGKWLPVPVRFSVAIGVTGMVLGAWWVDHWSVRAQVFANAEAVQAVDSIAADVRDLDAKVENILCLLTLEEGRGPLTCAVGVRK